MFSYMSLEYAATSNQLSSAASSSSPLPIIRANGSMPQGLRLSTAHFPNIFHALFLLALSGSGRERSTSTLRIDHKVAGHKHHSTQ